MKKKTPRTPYWWSVLAKAEAREKKGRSAFTNAEIEGASNWTTCACGKQDKRIPRDSVGMPLDGALWGAGNRFYTAVSSQSISRAEAALLEVERHAERVLRIVTLGGSRG